MNVELWNHKEEIIFVVMTITQKQGETNKTDWHALQPTLTVGSR